MNTSHAATPITAREVSEAERLDCLPRHFGRHFLRIEGLIYHFMGELSPDYRGGYWRFFEVSNGSFYMAPDLGMERVRIQVDNGYTGQMTTDAAGITACLFALSHISFVVQDDAVIERFHLLRAYAMQHAEAAEISRAMD